MSDLLSDALQTAVFDRLSSDAALGAIVGVHVYDAVPAGPVPALYVLIGEESVKDASDQSGAGAIHDISISVMSTANSFLVLKQAAAAIWQALDSAHLTPARGRIIGLWFRTSQAKRSNAGQRKIDLKFRARLEV